MSETIINNDGIPLARIGTRKIAYFNTVGVPSKATQTFDKKAAGNSEDTFKHNGVDYASWGSDNQQPEEYIKLIEKTGVLQTAINFKSRCYYGQGIIPVTIDGYDEFSNEILKPVNDLEVINLLRGYPVRKSMLNSVRDLNKLGNTFSVFHFSDDGTKILRTDTLNARLCRISVDKTKLVYSNDFADKGKPGKDAQVFDILNENDPLTDLELLKETGKLKGKTIAFPRIKNYLSNNDYYAAPDWYAAHLAGWLDVAHTIPVFLKAMYENALTLMWHIKIPYKYWERKFPKQNYKSTQEWLDEISREQDSIEESLIGAKNAHKVLFTYFEINDTGKAEEQWIIEPLKNKIETDDKLTLSAAANSEILFSLMVNPSVLGAGMPGGPYSGNAGSGSDIREGFLVSMILSYIERSELLDPIEYMLRFNGYGEVDLRFRQIVLTTLDKGKHTDAVVS